MGRSAGWMLTTSGRPAMRWPGRPPVRRDIVREFWRRIAEGLSMPTRRRPAVCRSRSAAGCSDRVAMPSVELEPGSGRYLSFAEREEIALARQRGEGVRDIATMFGRSPATISRELRRNSATRSGRVVYRASVAQWKAE